MYKVIMAIAVLGMAVLFGMTKTPVLAAEAGNFSRLPAATQAPTPSLELVGYRHGSYYCQYRECASYYYCGYYKKCCSSYQYYDCAPYGGYGGGYYKKHYYGGGGGGY